MPLRPCSSCGCHHRVASATCPCCGAALSEDSGGRGLTLAAALLGLAVGCGDKDDSGDSPGPQPEYGVALTDQDEDGVSVEEGDCNDNDASIFPGATDVAGDGIDSDCDSADD